MSWNDAINGALESVRVAGQYRSPCDLTHGTPRTELSATGKPVTSFASNDYLGLSQHPAVKAAAKEAIETLGTGAGSARLIVGSRPGHSQLERRLADWHQVEAAVLFSSGYAANLGVLTTFGAFASVMCSDELNHASIIDGCRLSKCPTRVYPHSDVEALNEVLADSNGRGVVVSDTVFSMDGDLAPVNDLAAACSEHNALLILDDAHVVFDAPGGPADTPALRVGTLSKTLGSLGGYVCGPQRYIDLLVNKARPYIFTTASTPAQCAAATAALDITQSAEGRALKNKLRGHVDRIRPGHPSPIIPIVIGEEAKAVAVSAFLADKGILVPAIRPPTVPVGTSRLRLTLSAAHSAEEIEHLLSALQEVDLHAT